MEADMHRTNQRVCTRGDRQSRKESIRLGAATCVCRLSGSGKKLQQRTVGQCSVGHGLHSQRCVLRFGHLEPRGRIHPISVHAYVEDQEPDVKVEAKGGRQHPVVRIAEHGWRLVLWLLKMKTEKSATLWVSTKKKKKIQNSILPYLSKSIASPASDLRRNFFDENALQIRKKLIKSSLPIADKLNVESSLIPSEIADSLISPVDNISPTNASVNTDENPNIKKPQHFEFYQLDFEAENNYIFSIIPPPPFPLFNPFLDAKKSS
ncbi:hypothetical protein HK096_003635 [Nowakowskiella sp. JEL0078]|nr:hypothetical protein HK096_003635 [Nowakowskiella sp. JEL0078]